MEEGLLLTGSRRASYLRRLQAMGPIALWPMDSLSGTTARDATPNGRNGTYSGVTLGQPGIGDGKTSPLFDGVNDFCDVYSASLAGAFNGDEGSLVAWAKVSGAGVWTDGTSRYLVSLQADATNYQVIRKYSTNNTLRFDSRATNTKTVSVTTSLAGWFHAALTWSRSADEVKVYLNGVQQGAAQTGLGAWAGTLVSNATVIGSSSSSTPASCWSGWLAYVAVFARALTPGEVARAARK